MGHPGAPNHDHHRSLWFAHNDLMGVDFWSENTPARIVQKQWYAIQEQDEFATIGLELHWLDGHDPQAIARQNVFITLRANEDTWSLELQSDFLGGGQGVAFRKSNFGILGLRVAKSLSSVFGAGTMTGSSGDVGEKSLFGKANRWVDITGPIELKENGQHTVEGLALIDHRDNPGHPAKWHVRDDGWMGPSLSRDQDIPLDSPLPLTIRYLLCAHSGPVDAAAVGRWADEFDTRPAWSVSKGTQPHFQWDLTPRR